MGSLNTISQTPTLVLNPERGGERGRLTCSWRLPARGFQRGMRPEWRSRRCASSSSAPSKAVKQPSHSASSHSACSSLPPTAEAAIRGAAGPLRADDIYLSRS